MNVIRPILADHSTSISELKKNPMAILEQSDGATVAVLNRNKPVFYCVSADEYELLLSKLKGCQSA